MKYYNYITFFILILFLLINVGRAEVLPNDINIKDKNSMWVAGTYIIIPLNDTTQNEIIRYYYIPNNNSIFLSDMIGDETGILTSDIEFYIDNEKQNFNEFFLLVNDNGNFKIILKKNIRFNKSTELKLKFNKKLSPDILSIDMKTATFKFNRDFNLNPDQLFEQYVFRIPAANAQNIKINFINSILYDSDDIKSAAPVSEVKSTNKYLEISYLFWNEGLRNKVVSDEYKYSIGLNPNSKYFFQNIFSIEYDTVKWDWVLESVVVAILLTIAFILGTLWQIKIIKGSKRLKLLK